MRVNGSIKSVTNGVTTLKDQLSVNGYAKEQINFMSDEAKGLQRRPPFESVNTFFPSGPSPQESLIVKTNNPDNPLWISINQAERDEITGIYTNFLGVSAVGGNSSYDNLNNWFDFYNYMESASSEEDIAVETVGDTTFIVNKNVTVEALEELSEGNRTSMILCKRAVEKGQKCKLSIEDGPGNGRVIVEVTFTQTDTGLVPVTVMAENIRDAVEAATSNLRTTANNSTVIFNTSDEGVFNEFTNVIVLEDRNNTLVDINGFVTDVADVPAYANDDEVIEVRPITATGDTVEGTSYYLRANNPVTTNTPTEFAVIGTLTEVRNTINANVDSVETIATASDGTVAGIPDTGTVAGAPYGNTLHAVRITTSGWEDLTTNDQTTFIYEVELWVDSSTAAEYKKGELREISTGEVLYKLPGNTTDNLLGLGFTFTATSAENPAYSKYKWVNNVPQNSDTVLGRWPKDGETYSLETAATDLGENNKTLWEETARLGEVYKLNPLTMPFILTNEKGTDVFSILPAEWEPRESGDSKSAPLPSFVGNTIRDVSWVQGRLSFVSGDKFITSRSGNIFSFFRGTAISILATDPIDIFSTIQGTGRFEYIVPSNRDLILFSTIGQFKIDGSKPLDPRTVSLALLTRYEFAKSTKPLPTGDIILFATKEGMYSGLDQMSVNAVHENLYTAGSVTEHVRDYIEGNILHMEASQTLGMAFFVTDAYNGIYLMEFSDANDRVAWSKWELPSFEFGLNSGFPVERIDYDATPIIRNIALKGTDLHIVMEKQLLVQGNGEAAAIRAESLVCRIRRDDTIGDNPTGVYLDYTSSNEFQVSVSGAILSSSNRVGETNEFVVVDPGANRFVYPINRPLGTVPVNVFFEDLDLIGLTGVSGVRYSSTYIPHPPRIRDEGGYMQNRVRNRILNYLVSLTDTGYLTAEIISRKIANYPNYPIQEYTGLVSGLDAQGDTLVLEDGLFNVGFKQDTKNCDLKLSTNHHSNAIINQIEWLGNYINRGRRF